jgi:CRP/FNR family transcriptional regulator
MNGHDWLQQFPQLSRLDEPVLGSLLEHIRLVELPPEHVVYHIGERCEHFLLVLNGTVRVQMFSRSGHEIVLYRVVGGQSCILTTTSLLAGEVYQAEAMTETKVQAALLPTAAFEELMTVSAVFRHFVFANYGRRLTELLGLISTVAFERMDVRLAHVLVQRSGRKPVIHITHQELANELGTAREVVSRLLKDLERREVISLHRGYLVIEDEERLRQVSHR